MAERVDVNPQTVTGATRSAVARALKEFADPRSDTSTETEGTACHETLYQISSRLHRFLDRRHHGDIGIGGLEAQLVQFLAQVSRVLRSQQRMA